MFRKIHWKASVSGHIQKVEPKTRYVQWDLRPEIRDAYDTWEPKRGDGNQGYYDKRDPIP